jgi:hypothetical protein
MSGAAVRWGERRAAGTGRREIDRAVGAGVLVRPDRGVLALPDASTAAVWLARERAVLTCASAAEHYGLWVLEHKLVLHAATRSGSTAPHVNHYFRGAERVSGPRVARLKDAVVQSLRCLPELEALVIAESAVSAGSSSAARAFRCSARCTSRASAGWISWSGGWRR